MARRSKIHVGLEIGTSKVCAAVGDIGAEDELVLGIGGLLRPVQLAQAESPVVTQALQDIADARTAQGLETFPAEFADRLLAGESPLKVRRACQVLTVAPASSVTATPATAANAPRWRRANFWKR